MRTNLTLLAIIFPLLLLAQSRTEKKFCDRLCRECDSATAVSYLICQYVDNNDTMGKIHEYDLSGVLISTEEYSNVKKRIKNGLSLTYHENGNIKLKEYYHENKRSGELTTYFEDGVLRRREIYENGKVITGQCYTRSSMDTTYFPYEVMAEFPGGTDKMLQFIQKNIRYPNKARRDGISGRVFVNFIVDKNGFVKDAIILRSADALLDAEALRLVNHMPQWKPGQIDGEDADTRYNLPVKFSLGKYSF
jgi:protein TonB